MRRRGNRPRSSGPRNGGLRRAIGYLFLNWKLAAATYAAVLIATLGQLAIPQLVQNILDAVVKGAQAKFSGRSVDEHAIWAAMGTIAVFAVVRGVFVFLQGYLAERSSQNVAYDLRNELFEKVQRLSFSYHDRNQTGQLMVRATDDVEKARLFLGQGLVIAMQAVALLVGILIVLFLTNARLTLVVLPILPVAIVLFMIFGAITQPLFGEVQRRLSRLNTILQENLAGIKVVKAFVQEPREKVTFNAAADSLMNQQLTVSRIFSFLFPVVFLTANLGQAAVLYFGGKQIIGGTLTLGEWQKFSLYLIYAFLPIGQLGFIISLMSQANTSAGRIFEILDATNEVVDRPGAVALGEIQGRVEFRDVTFRYYQSGEPILKDVSFVAEPGQSVALLGATGSGKTTIINLIPRFYDASEGAVLIDGIDVRDVTIESLRRQIGIVLQETTLFSGTIRDNIAFGRTDATMDEIIAAARAARAHDFIMSFPEGYDTPVGERGTTLSGGQKQRIAIARALLLNPRILILDDSTSAVDVATEALIQEALDRLMQGRTSFVIAQRISTVLNADQILVLDRGRIVARGTHEELLEASPIYADIYHSQLVGDAAETGAGAEGEPLLEVEGERGVQP
ncbi:MAG: ABC transporter ATP-binding protein/permease [Ardenticatenaceae bacterium]|nr:ABC transporter ATP-binding protein/permease [Ardenticatenaceae bacterium]